MILALNANSKSKTARRHQQSTSSSHSLQSYCCPTAANPPLLVPKALADLWYLQEKQRAGERTRTADLLQLRVIHQALQRVARGCKSRISKPISLLWFAECCTVLHSRWCQSGIRTSDNYSLTSGPIARNRALRSHNPLKPVSTGGLLEWDM